MSMPWYNRWISVQRGFLRIGNADCGRLVIAHESRALFSTRSRGRKFGSYYVLIGKG